MPQIVVLNVSQTQAPAPSTLQQSGAIISQGATTIAQGTTGLLTQLSDLTPLLAAPLALSSLAWSSGTVLATTGAAIAGRSVGDKFITTIAGAVPAGYNGTFRATVTGANTFTYALGASPGSETTAGTYTPAGQGELQAQVNSFFGQGTNRSVAVLELGPGDQTTGPAALSAYIATYPNSQYIWLIPRGWDASTGLLALLALYQAPNAKVYFFLTTTLSTYAAYAGMKNVHWLIEAPGLALTEFTEAAALQAALAYAPSSTNRMTQFKFKFLNGVTAYPTFGNGPILTAIKAAFGNVVGTGAEGGLPNTKILDWGSMADGNDFAYWYSVDNLQLTLDQQISAAIINGNNDPLSPLYYDQPGINTLQDIGFQVLTTEVASGLANGFVARAALDGPVFTQQLETGVFADTNVINAVPFITYTTENPNNYKAGIYGGFSIAYIPQRGFDQIIINVNVTDFISQ